MSEHKHKIEISKTVLNVLRSLLCFWLTFRRTYAVYKQIAATIMLIAMPGKSPVFSRPHDIASSEVPIVVFHVANLEYKRFSNRRLLTINKILGFINNNWWNFNMKLNHIQIIVNSTIKRVKVQAYLIILKILHCYYVFLCFFYIFNNCADMNLHSD